MHCAAINQKCKRMFCRNFIWLVKREREIERERLKKHKNMYEANVSTISYNPPSTPSSSFIHLFQKPKKNIFIPTNIQHIFEGFSSDCIIKSDYIIRILCLNVLKGTKKNIFIFKTWSAKATGFYFYIKYILGFLIIAQQR